MIRKVKGPIPAGKTLIWEAIFGPLAIGVIGALMLFALMLAE